MKIIIVRHCDPDYRIDSLTERGFREREALTEYLLKQDVKDVYVSSLGRAQRTAEPWLEAKGITPVICDWLREFTVDFTGEEWNVETMGAKEHDWYMAWDRMPSDWTSHDAIYGRESWRTVPGFDMPKFLAAFDDVCAHLDEVLASHGYEREGLNYRVTQGNMDTVAFVCHFGLECVLLSHLLNISPEVLWQMTLARPSSVTALVTEEREEGIASFRMTEFGGTSHLYAAGLEPSKAGLFKECYGNTWERQ